MHGFSSHFKYLQYATCWCWVIRQLISIIKSYTLWFSVILANNSFIKDSIKLDFKKVFHAICWQSHTGWLTHQWITYIQKTCEVQGLTKWLIFEHIYTLRGEWRRLTFHQTSLQKHQWTMTGIWCNKWSVCSEPLLFRPKKTRFSVTAVSSSSPKSREKAGERVREVCKMLSFQCIALSLRATSLCLRRYGGIRLCLLETPSVVSHFLLSASSSSPDADR